MLHLKATTPLLYLDGGVSGSESLIFAVKFQSRHLLSYVRVFLPFFEVHAVTDGVPTKHHQSDLLLLDYGFSRTPLPRHSGDSRTDYRGVWLECWAIQIPLAFDIGVCCEDMYCPVRAGFEHPMARAILSR